METHTKENDQADRPTIPGQDDTQDPHDRKILEPHKRIQRQGVLWDMQQNGVDEPHINSVQRKEHSHCMAPSENPVAPPKHPMAPNHPRNDPRMREHNPTTKRTKEKQPETTVQDDPPRPVMTTPDHPVRIGIPHMGPKVRTGYPRKTPPQRGNQSEMASRNQ